MWRSVGSCATVLPAIVTSETLTGVRVVAPKMCRVPLNGSSAEQNEVNTKGKFHSSGKSLPQPA